MTYHLQNAVISKHLELQQRDWSQMKDLLKQILKPIEFFLLYQQKSSLLVITGGQDFCPK